MRRTDMPELIKIEEVTLKEVDLTLFETKTIQHGFPINPPRFVYHIAAFSVYGNWFIHHQRFITPSEAAELQALTREAGTIDTDHWSLLIEFNEHLHNAKDYEDFIARFYIS